MDPDACLDRLVDALNDGDGDEARAAATDLGIWIGRDGFIPEGLLSLGLTRSGAHALLHALATAG